MLECSLTDYIFWNAQKERAPINVPKNAPISVPFVLPGLPCLFRHLPAFTETNKKRRRKIYVFFEQRETPVTVNGEIHTHVELDGKEVGNTTTPIVDMNLAG